MRLHAFLINNVVVKISLVDEGSFYRESIGYDSLIDVHDRFPVVCVGWISNGNKLEAPFLDEDQKLQISIDARKKFADELLEKFKARNIKDGINALQAMHMHHLLRAYNVTFAGVPMIVDIMNMAISGDLEVACLSLLYGETEDGSLPYHWMTASRKLWLINELKSFLGWA